MKPAIELEMVIQQMIEYITDVAPEVAIKRESVIFEDEDKNLSVYPPLAWNEERCLNLQEIIGEHVLDVQLATGYVVAVYVYMPEQQVQETQQELAKLQKRTEAAQKKLAEAAQLGLLQPAKLVPA